MSTAVPPERNIALTDTIAHPEPGRGVTEESNTHGASSTEIVTDTGSGGRQEGSSTGSTQDNFNLLWGLRKYLVLLGILAVGVTYNAGLTPPGGFWNKTQDGHEAGDPALRDEFPQRYEVFFYCNATAFAASLVILLLSKSVTSKELWLHSIQFTMIVDLFSLMAAFATGSCRALKSSLYTSVLVIIAIVYVWIHIIVSTRIVPEALKKKVQTVVNCILSKLGIFDGQTSDLVEEKDLEEARKFILMLVTFAATVTYQAGLNPPGGFWAENDYASGSSPPYKHRPATPVLRSHYLRRYNIFVSCNSTSFVASLVTVMLLLSPEFSRYGIRSKAVVVCVVADLFCLIGAYAAGCCRDVATSFYVMFIIAIVLIFFGFLAVAFVYKPVADLLEKIKSGCVLYTNKLGQTLSSTFGSSRSNKAQLEGSHASHPQDSVHAPGAEDSASVLEAVPAGNGNQQDSSTTEVEACGEYPPAENLKMENAEESQSNSWHQSTNSQQSIKSQLAANLETANTRDGMSSENQHASGMTDKSSPDDVKTTDMPADGFCEKSMPPGDYKESVNDIIVVEEPSLPVEASDNVDLAEENTSGGYNNCDIESGVSNNNAELVPNGRTGNNQGAVVQNSCQVQAEQHLKKTRTNLLLLAILAVSLTYQSGLNPPGGFWSGSDRYHSAGDRILEDTDHSRFIAFFYLNAIAFVTSIVTILMLLDKNLTMKVTKRRELQIAMIVDLLSLTGAFVMGSCRDAEKSISISVLVCLVLAYVAIHILIAIHVISPKFKDLVSKIVKCLGHKKTGNITKELERRCNLLLTVAILAATVTYQAGMNPPGGVWSDDSDLTRTPGNPILQDKHPGRYDVFYYSNSVSFVSSVVITILLLNKESCERGIKFYALRVCLVVGLLGLLIAYAAGSCRNWKESIFLIIIAVAVLISLVVQILVSSMHNMVGIPLAQFIGFLQRLVFVSETENTGRENTSASPEASDSIGKKERKRHKYLMLIAILAASSTYQAALSPPGGFWSDDVNGHFAGDPVLHDINHRRYKTFFCFNAISFMASIVVIMLLLSRSVRKKDVPLEVLLLIMILDLLALMIAFAAGSCRKFRTSVYVFMLVAGVVIYLIIVIILSRGIEKCLRKVKRSGLFSSRHPEHGSRAITPVLGE